MQSPGRPGLFFWIGFRSFTLHAFFSIDSVDSPRNAREKVRMTMRWIGGLKQRAGTLKAQTLVLYLAARHPQTPWYAKLLVAAVVAYALSPIDLIPDFVPVLGYLDDLILLPLGIAWAIRLIPPTVMAECRARAQSDLNGKSVGRVAAAVITAVIVLIWAGLTALLALGVYRAWPGLLRVGH
jgi:uncharacterized membrane protein YkvA (DUF1232 family)